MTELEIKKNGKHLVELYGFTSAALIVEASTGVIYTNQGGGTRCSQPEMEGFLVPVLKFDEYRACDLLADFWFDPGYKYYTEFIEEKLPSLDELLAVCGGYPLTPTGLRIRIDRSRTHTIEWGEAWVPVVSAYGPGILTWENSD